MSTLKVRSFCNVVHLRVSYLTCKEQESGSREFLGNRAGRGKGEEEAPMVTHNYNRQTRIDNYLIKEAQRD